MAWSNGTFSRLYNWVTDRNAGVKIQATKMDAEDDGFAAGINQCMNKDGSNAATGNLNIGGFRLTNGGNATARTDYPTTGQIQDGGTKYALTSGTNTVTATISPAITAYANGQEFILKIANTTTAASTLNINSIGALNKYYPDGTTQLVAGSEIQNNVYKYVYDSSLNSSAGGFICINASDIVSSFTATLATGLTTTPTGTVSYRIVGGKTVHVWVSSAITGTSNANGMTITGVPAAIQPTTAPLLYCAWTDNGGTTGGSVTMSGGTWTARAGTTLVNTSGFTTSGTKGINAFFRLVYSLD